MFGFGWFEICYTVNCVIVAAVVVIDNYIIKLFVGLPELAVWVHL